MGFLDNLTEIATDLAQSGAAASKHLAETSIAVQAPGGDRQAENIQSG